MIGMNGGRTAQQARAVMLTLRPAWCPKSVYVCAGSKIGILDKGVMVSNLRDVRQCERSGRAVRAARDGAGCKAER